MLKVLRLLAVLLTLFAGGGAWAQSSPFTVSNGQILYPNGQVWNGRGININFDQLDLNAMLALFPGLGVVRVALLTGSTNYNSLDLNALDNFVLPATARGIVVILEHHAYPQNQSVQTGAALQAEVAFYVTMANRYKNSPNAAYVWFSSTNEPVAGDGTGSQSTVTDQEMAQYNGLRAAGYNGPFLFELIGGGVDCYVGSNPGCPGLTVGAYANVVNGVWDLHPYGKSTSAAVTTLAQAAQQIHFSQGVPPVFFGEYGLSQNGLGTDNLPANLPAVQGAQRAGSTAWAWNPGPGDNLTDGAGSLNGPLSPNYGTQVAGFIGTTPPPLPGGGSSETLTVTTPAQVAAGATFTVSGTVSGVSAAPVLQYQDNGGAWAAFPAGATVSATAFSFQHPGMTANGAATVAVRDGNNTSISAQGPPFVVKGTESPDQTDITTVGPTIVNADGDVFSLSSDGFVVQNGVKDTVTSANVVEIAYVSHTFYQKNTSGDWYWKVHIGDTYQGPSTTSPLTGGGGGGGGGGSGNRVVAPLTGTVTTGTWTSVDLNGASATPTFALPSGKPFHFNVLLPAQYNPSVIYPILVWLHPDFEGNPWYQGSNNPLELTNYEPAGYNTVPFRTNYPAIVIVGYADQTSGNDAVDNWGGWTNNGTTGSCTHASGDTGPNTCAVLAAINYVKATYSADSSRVYCDGFSLGGIGCEWLALKYNLVNGNPKVFAAATSTGGVIEANGFGAGPTAANATTMTNVPVWWISGQSDGTSLPGDWNLPMWQRLAGNTNYPTPNGNPTAAASQAGSTQYHLWYDPAIGHQDTNASGAFIHTLKVIKDWQFAQAGTQVTPPPAETIGVNLIPQQQATVGFTISGVIGNASTAPTLQYQDNGGAWLALPTSTAVRNPYKQPGGNGSVWNTPIGAGATFGAATDLDTIDIARGWNGSAYTAGPVGIINSTANYGQTSYVGALTDGQYTFSSSNLGRTVAPDNGGTVTATMHVPTGAIAPGPYPADNSIVLADPINYPNRQYSWGGLQIQPPGLQPGQGPFAAGSMEWDDVTSDSYGEDQETGNDGYNIGAGLINACDVDPTCNPVYPRIQHGLRYSTDAHLLKDNAVVTGQQVLKPDSWPQRLQDGQSGINLYSGNLKAGTTLAIPSTTAMPGGLNANCQGAFWTFQHYPLLWRDQAGGGFHLTADQVADTSQYVTDLRSCLPQLVGLLRPMRNQHQGGQSFTSNPKNGPGARLDTGPLPLTGTGGGTVTATSFSFPHPGMAALPANTVAVRDAAQTTVVGTSNSFAVIGQQTEALTVGQIGTQTAGTPFTVSGTIANATGTPGLQYRDGSGAWVALPAGSTITNTGYSFIHPAMAAVGSTTISIRDANQTTVTVTSNAFAVSAAPVEVLTVATIAGQTAGTGFTVTGTIANATGTPTLQYQDNAGAWASLPAGSVVSSSAFTFPHPALAASGSNTVSVRDASNTAIVATSNAFKVQLAPSPNNTVVITVGPTIINSAGDQFALAANGQVTVNGVADGTTSGTVALAYVSGKVWQKNSAGLWSSKTLATDTWSSPGTLTSPLPPETLAIAAIGQQAVGIPFTVSGTITASLVPPTLQYSVSNGPWLNLPSGAQVSNSAFSFGVPAIATPSAAATIAVRDAGNVTRSATSNAFAVLAAVAEAITVNPVPTQRANQPFPVTGNIVAAASIPVLQYRDGTSGAWLPLPSGAQTTLSTYAFMHPGLATAASTIIQVRDSANPTVIGACPAFGVFAAESPNNTVVTNGAQSIVDSAGHVWTITLGMQVAADGTADSTTSNVVELAYVNRVVWYEDTLQRWYSKASFSAPWSAPTALGPLPSSHPGIMRSNLQPLAVVPGFTVKMPGLSATNTIAGGTYRLSVVATLGVVNMQGCCVFGSGTATVSVIGDINAVNQSLASMTFSGRGVGAAQVSITLTDATGTTTSIRIPVTVAKSPAVIQHGKSQPLQPRRRPARSPGRIGLRNAWAPRKTATSQKSVSRNGPYATAGDVFLRPPQHAPVKGRLRSALSKRERSGG